MRQPDADTNGRNLRPVLMPTRGLPSETVRDLAPGPREEPRRRTARGIHWQADTDGAPGGERTGRHVRRGRNVDTRLEDGDWDIGVFLTYLPSRAEHNPVRTEADPEHRGALSHARPRLPASAVPGAAGGGRRRQAQAAQDEEPLVPPSSAVRRPGRNPGTSATRCQGCARPPGPGRCSPEPCMRAAPASGSGCPSLSRALADVFATAAVGFLNGTTWQVATAESLDVRNLPNSYRSASNGGDSALPEWREAMAGNLYWAVAAWREHRVGGRECTGGV